METTTATVTILQNAEEAKRYLLDVGVQGPSLHPYVGSDDHWKRWNGWNHAKACGVDAEGRLVEMESWHFAAGGVDYSTSRNGGMGSLGSLAFQGFCWPIQVFPAIAVIRHPEYTPGL